MSQEEFDKLKLAYQETVSAIDALQQQLQSLNKEQEARVHQIRSYLRENNITSVDIGGASIKIEEKATPSVPKYDIVKRIRKHLYAALQVSTKNWSKIFDQYDLNGDGEISLKEFRAALRGPSANLSEHILPDSTLRALFNTIDVDNSGGIDSSEFLNWLQEEGSEKERANSETDEITWSVGLGSMTLPGIDDDWDLDSPTSDSPTSDSPTSDSPTSDSPNKPAPLTPSRLSGGEDRESWKSTYSSPHSTEENILHGTGEVYSDKKQMQPHEDRDNSGLLTVDQFKRLIRQVDGQMRF
jgi:hypothetical protein